MYLMIDNYDSFTYNLVQYLGQLGCDVAVHRNDEITLEEIEAMAPEAIFLSPGPCTPKEAGVTVEVIRRFHERIPIMGICLGHQAIGYAFGAEVVRADRLMHGKTSPVFNDGRTIFKGLPNPFTAGRYHSLLVQRDTLPPFLEVSAETEEGEVMGLRHRHYPLEGVQFHPESVLTPNGKRILRNFLEMVTGNGQGQGQGQGQGKGE
jgi:anthranilate synthase/aminodeoxychorismate synthase-like glutamine amidotransferase